MITATPAGDTAGIRVVIVEDFALVATTVARALETMPDMTIVAVTGSCAGALTTVSEHQPDVLLLDQRLPDGKGTDVLPALMARCPRMKVLLVTAADSEDISVAAIAGGATGVIHKGRRLDALIQAVRDAARSDAGLPPDVLHRLPS